MNLKTQDAFLQWYEPIHESFARLCANKAFGLMQTEDLMQEVILATLEAFDRVQDKEKLLGFMIGTANNIVRNHKRRLKFRGVWEEERFKAIEAKITSPETATDVHLLLQAMERLSPNEKEAIELFEISGFSIREISEIQQRSEAAVKTGLSRARKNLRQLLNHKTPKASLSSTLAAYASILL